MYETNRTEERPAVPEDRPRGNGQDSAPAATAAAQLADRAAEIEERVRTGARYRSAQARRYIRANPFATAGIAFAAGIVLSALLRR